LIFIGTAPITNIAIAVTFTQARDLSVNENIMLCLVVIFHFRNDRRAFMQGLYSIFTGALGQFVVDDSEVERQTITVEFSK